MQIRPILTLPVYKYNLEVEAALMKNIQGVTFVLINPNELATLQFDRVVSSLNMLVLFIYSQY